METEITIIEARYKPDYFPMKKGTKWTIGAQLEYTSMSGEENWQIPHGNKAKGVDENGRLYVLWTYVGKSNKLEFGIRAFNDNYTHQAVSEKGETWMWY